MSDTRLTKRKKAALITGISFIVLSVSLAIPSLAWFAKAQTSSRLDGLSGTAHGSYFNGGDGSKDNPFEINNPKQLYYFNWLQDLGYFNMPNDGKTAIDQLYFKLTSDLDMTGYTLPPAGTKQYPFVGNFDGASHSISNLVITNDESALKQADPPKGATYSDGTLSQAQIVGFFGVVGSLDGSDKVNSYTYDTKANAINNLGFDGLDVISSSSSTLMGLAAGYVNGLIKGVGVKDSSLQAKSSATPITDVAGVKNISDYSLVGYATEDYKSQTEVRDETLATPQIDNPNTNHGSTNWGGSVNMKQMYNDLESEERNKDISQDVYYVSSESVTVSPEGIESEPTNIAYGTGYSSKFTQSESSYGSRYYYRNGERTDAEGNVIASYGLPYEDLDSQKYVFILGSYKATSSSLEKTVTQTIQAYEKTISKNGVYLALDPSSSGSTRSLIATSDPSKALHWQFKDGKVTTTIKSPAATGGVVTSTLALTGNGSTPSLTSATGTNVWTWTFDEEKGNLSATRDGTTYYLDLENGSWILRSSPFYLTIKDTSSNTYLAYSKDEYEPVGSSSGSSDTAAWQYDSTNTCYRPVANSQLMLSVVSTNWEQKPILTTKTKSDNSSYARFTLSGANSDGTGTGYLKVDNFDGDGRTSYLVYSSNSFQVSYRTGWFGQHSNLPGQKDNFQIAKVENTPVEAGLRFGSVKDSVYTSETREVRRPATATVNPTYVPLAFSYSDANKTTISGVSDMNTGYLVGGANYVNSDDRAGDIRASKYYTLKQLYKSFGKSSSSTRYTYDTENLQVLTHSSTKKIDGSYSDNGWTKIKDNYNSSSNVSVSGFTKSVDSSIFSRYDNARQNLQYTICGTYDNASMSGNTTLYGIHFMDAAISKDHLTTVGKATVYDRAAEAQYQENLKKYLAGELGEAPKQTGSVYKDYEVPEDSIDFNLATDGYVTFFGASYYVNTAYGENNSFFGLSEIIRDENQKITDIRSIQRIYANLGPDKAEKPYVYAYDRSLPANTDENHMIFDVSWISTDVQMENYCLYYFEIPINSGEYALGSVSGKNGAYLLYLDIGTGAADYQSVTIEEKTTSKIIKQSYPLGVDFIADVKEVSNIEGGQSAAIALLSTPVDKLKYTISSNGSATTITCSKAENLEIISQADAVTVSGPAGEDLPSVSDRPLTITMNRKTIQTFSPANNRLSLAYSCTWTVDGASAGDEIQLYFPASTGEWLVIDGSASIDKGTQVLTVNSGTSASVKAEGTGTKDATSDWMGPVSITVESVFSEFKIHVDNSTANVEYTYEELSKTYVITIHCAVAFKVNVISLPADSEYKIQINGTTVTSTGELNFAAQA